ncbi:MAG: NAD(P)-dependent oxidoreductase [Bauldia sp.]|nr:NAD(P)-dependent oxidoreductase [Bauldia sp.]
MASIGFIGLGRMGMPMSARLVAAGHRLLGFDLSDAIRARFAEQGGEPVSSPEEAAAADVVILMLPDSAAVASVVADSGFSAAIRPETTIIDMGSSEPMATRALAGAMAERGVRFFDAPVSGGVRGAEDGKLTIMVGSPEDAFAALADLLSPLGRVVHAGEVGSGHAIKALNNLLSATHLMATNEAIRVGKNFGLDPKVMLDIINSSSGRSGSSEVKWPRFILNETYDSGFALRLMLKDMKIAVGLGEEVGAPMALGKDAEMLWEEAAAILPATADHTFVATWSGPVEGELPSRKPAAPEDYDRRDDHVTKSC